MMLSPLTDFFFMVVFLLLATTSVVLHRVWLNVKQVRQVSSEVQETLVEIAKYKKLFLFFSGLTLFIYTGCYFTVKLHWESHVMEWLHLIVRWAHVLFGIAWIGASFYFIFLENSLNRTENLREELAGNLWAIHGGGFYYVEKHKSAPSEIPRHLHWFKYEAYFTWLTGMLLLALVYFMNAKAVMIDTSVMSITPPAAIAIAVSVMLAGWLLYDGMCRSPLLQKKKLFGTIGLCIVVLIAYLLTHLLSGRAAFMLVGALLGTIMAGNVFFCIIPSQKALVAAAKANKPVNPELGKVAGLRSLHNNYITLPVVFIMISNHFPVTYGTSANWMILAGLIIASVAVRHFINLYEKGIYTKWMIPFATVAMIALVIVTAPKPKRPANELPAVSFLQVQPVFQKRCTGCHSSAPTDDVNTIAPGGIMFDTPEEIKKHADRILVRAVQTRTMPQGNKTAITEEERELIGIWIEQGAKIHQQIND